MALKPLGEGSILLFPYMLMGLLLKVCMRFEVWSLIILYHIFRIVEWWFDDNLGREVDDGSHTFGGIHDSMV